MIKKACLLALVLFLTASSAVPWCNEAVECDNLYVSCNAMARMNFEFCLAGVEAGLWPSEASCLQAFRSDQRMCCEIHCVTSIVY